MTFSKDGHLFRCDSTVHLATGLKAQSSASAGDIYAAFDQGADRIEKQIRRYKRRLKDHHQKRSNPIDAIEASAYVLDAQTSEADEPETLQPVQYYFKVPEDLGGRLVICLDPMLATGNSSAAAVDLLKKAGATDLRFLCLLAAPEGVARMKEAHPDVPIVTAALDERLNDHGYIVPGLGDAGDRMFGTK